VDSQVIDFPIDGFRLLPRKGNVATQPLGPPEAIANGVSLLAGSEGGGINAQVVRANGEVA
jgi:hypothetical protein